MSLSGSNPVNVNALHVARVDHAFLTPVYLTNHGGYFSDQTI